MKVFVDTSALYSALDEAEPNHQVALELFDHYLGQEELVTHNYIHVETEQLVRRRLGATAAELVIDRFLPAMRTVWVDELLHATALATIRGEGRGVSLVDQISFLVMRREGILEALAFDADFEAAGFRLLGVTGRRPGDHRLSDAPAPYAAVTSPQAELVGVAEIAARSGRSPNTVQSWRRRHADFPAPNIELAAGPIWLWGDVSAWIARRSPSASRAGGL